MHPREVRGGERSTPTPLPGLTACLPPLHLLPPPLPLLPTPPPPPLTLTTQLHRQHCGAHHLHRPRGEAVLCAQDLRAGRRCQAGGLRPRQARPHQDPRLVHPQVPRRRRVEGQGGWTGGWRVGGCTARWPACWIGPPVLAPSPLARARAQRSPACVLLRLCQHALPSHTTHPPARPSTCRSARLAPSAASARRLCMAAASTPSPSSSSPWTTSLERP